MGYAKDGNLSIAVCSKTSPLLRFVFSIVETLDHLALKKKSPWYGQAIWAAYKMKINDFHNKLNYHQQNSQRALLVVIKALMKTCCIQSEIAIKKQATVKKERKTFEE